MRTILPMLYVILLSSCVSYHNPEFYKEEIEAIPKSSALKVLEETASKSLEDSSGFPPVCELDDDGYYGKDAPMGKSIERVESYLVPFEPGFYYQAFELYGSHYITLISIETNVIIKGSCSLGPLDRKEETIKVLAMLERLGGINWVNR